MTDRLRVVCFDLGGVVLRICRTWVEGCHAAGLDVRGSIDEVLGSSEAWPALEGVYQRGEIGLDEFTASFAEMIGGVYTADEVERVHHAWTLGEYPGVAALVDELHDAGLVTAVLSNTSHDHWITFSQRYPVFDRFGHRHGSHLIGACKPDPVAFRAIETSTGHTGRAIIFFDDLEPNVRGARAFGWESECVDPHGSPAEQIRSVLVERGAL